MRLGGKTVVFPYAFQYFLRHQFVRIKMVILAGLGAILVPLEAILGGSWAHLKPTWAPKRAQKGAQDDPKTTPKTTSFFKFIFGPILVRFGGAQGPSMAPQGGGAPRFGLLICAQAPGPLPVYMYIYTQFSTRNPMFRSKLLNSTVQRSKIEGLDFSS